MNYGYTFGNNVRTLRLQNSISREELASIAKLSLTTIAHVEQSFQNCTLKVLYQIAQALDIDASSLLFNYRDTKKLFGIKDNNYIISPLKIGEAQLLIKSCYGLHCLPIQKGMQNQLNFLTYLTVNNMCGDQLHDIIRNYDKLIDYAIDTL